MVEGLHKNVRKLNMLTALIGYRTYIATVIFMVCALLLQAHAMEAFILAPFVKVVVTMVGTLAATSVPLWIRKAIEGMKNKY